MDDPTPPSGGIPDGEPEGLNGNEIELLRLIRTVARDECRKALIEIQPTAPASHASGGLATHGGGVCLLLLQACLSAGIPQQLADGAVHKAWQSLKKMQPTLFLSEGFTAESAAESDSVLSQNSSESS